MKRRMRKKMDALKQKRGITLIALVIMIVIMLILAGVGIAMITAENGILNQATRARERTEIASIKEQIQIEILGVQAGNSGKITEKELNEIFAKYGTLSGEGEDKILITNKGYSIKVSEIWNGATSDSGNNGGEIAESKLTQEEKTALEGNGIAELIGDEITNNNLKNNENIKAVITGEVPIPTDGTYVDGNVDTGVVVEIAKSQFVWVPVLQISDMATETTGVDTNGRKNYQGKLYNFSGTTSTEMTNYGQGTNSQREPSLVTGDEADTYAVLDSIAGSKYDASSEYYKDILNYNSAKEFGKVMQEDYNAMVESVAKYGGFFVGRYESSISGNTVASISGVMPMTAETTSGNTWYGMYKLEKDYTNSNNLNSVQSSMIWGSQYDRMLNYILEGNDKEKVTKEKLGNHTDNVSETGQFEEDKMNNIFDLSSNVTEYTQEASGSTVRVYHGGVYSSVFVEPSSIRGFYYNPTTSIYVIGSRLSLYLK